MNFQTFLNRANPTIPTRTLIALDPGETTGYALFINGELVEASQLDTSTLKLGIPAIQDCFASVRTRYQSQPMVVFEDYRIYSWKTEQHTWAGLHTPQLLGVIDTIAYIKGWQTHRQMAQQAKQFCTDEKLKQWGYWRKGERHARDAIRHGCYYLLFGNRPDKIPHK